MNSSREVSQHVRPVPRYIVERDSFAPGAPSPADGDGHADEDGNYLRTSVRIGFKYRWLVGGFAGIILALTVLYNFLATPFYTAEATLKIGTYAPLLPSAELEDVLRQQTREQDYLNTQIELLNSLSLADQVLSDSDSGEELKHYFEKKTGFFSVFAPFWKLIIGGGSDVQEGPEDTSYDHPVTDLRQYLDLIAVMPFRKTSLVKVSATSTSPQLSAKLANAHAEGFINLVRNDRQKSTIENLVFLKNQTQELADKVALLERNIAAYAEENAIVSLNKDENITVKRMAELNQLLTESTGKRIKSETMFQEAASGSGVSSAAFDDDSIQQLRVALKEAESEYAMNSEKYKPTYPKMVQLKARITALKENLEQQRGQVVKGLEATFQADLQAEKEFQEQLEIQKSRAFELSRREVQYNIMKREYDSTKDLHQAVLRQLKEAQISSESSGSNISLADRAAVPLSPSSPKRFRNLLLALFLGPFLGCGLALTLEALDNTVKTPEDVQRSLKLPALGVVPLFSLDDDAPAKLKRARLSHEPETASADGPAKTDLSVVPSGGKEVAVLHQDLVTLNSPKSIASEAFRIIRTGILLSSADHPPKVILVTSGKKAEGKTTLVTNLAATLAQASSRTIVVDADLRRPALHRVFSINNGGAGLVDYLTGQKTLDQVILPSDINGLFLLPAGPVPPNPAELVGSKKMAELLEELRSQFDYVLVDTPPVLPVTDAVMLSRVVDGVVLVVRGQETQKHIAKEAVTRLHQVGSRVLGVVLNDVDFRSGDYYYYYRDTYSYYYAEDEVRTGRRKKRASA